MSARSSSRLLRKLPAHESGCQDALRADAHFMPKSALVVTSEFSRGARAMCQALENAGYRVSRSTLERVAAGQDAEGLLIDRSLPPYDLPAVEWQGRWWNRPDRVWNAWSKSRTAQVASQHGLRHPKTVAFESLAGAALDQDSEYVSITERAVSILDMLGGTVVVKPDRGMMGAGLRLADSVESLVKATSVVGFGVVQEFVPEATTTLRLICTHTEVVAAFARQAAEGGWRGNVAAGASVLPVLLSEHGEAARLATATVRALGLDMAGVDIVETPSGPEMLEANPSFGVGGLLSLYPDALDRLVACLSESDCSCGIRGPHDAWACE